MVDTLTHALTGWTYAPLLLAFASVAVGLLLVIFLLTPALKLAYERLGLSPAAALVLMSASLVGSAINLPISTISSGASSKLLAVNIGGCVIPTIMSIFLALQYHILMKAVAATALVAATCYELATPAPAVGLVIPLLLPILAAAISGFALSRHHAARLAYIAGSLGTLIGADLLNLGRFAELDAPIASIGGAGAFDGIFLVGMASVLLTMIPFHARESLPS
jgi:uncharacterized membrane protein